jgi:DNA-binding transcriptional MocR family regulator
MDWISKFASSNSRLKPSAIREILKVTRKPGIISFAGGVPDPKLFPYTELRDSQNKIVSESAASAYQYGLSQGSEELLDQICNLAIKLSRPCRIANILITNGSQQGLDLIARLFLEEGDVVAVTRPCYLGALQAFAPMSPDFAEVACDEDGPIITDLESALSKKPKFFYLVPSYQNPTGQSVTVERAKKILNLCRQAGVPIIEDAAYEGLFYDHRPQSLRELEALDFPDYDQDGNVIYLGTFSKVIAPGFRIGWVEAPIKVTDGLVVLKQSSDLHSSSFNQLIIADFLNRYSEEYWKILRISYRKKRDLMLALVQQYLATHLDYFSEPKGGLFVWGKLTKSIDCSELLKVAVEKYGIAFVPGSPFYAANPDINTLRLSFATASADEMEIGIKQLANLIDSFK